MRFRRIEIRKTKKPGCCPVKYCRNKPRDLNTHPNSTQLCGSHSKELWRAKNPVHAAYDNLRASALEDFIQVITPTRYMDDKGRERFSLHIDRINNSLGYIKGNICVCTCEENVLKGHAERKQSFVDAKIRGHIAAAPVEEDDNADPF